MIIYYTICILCITFALLSRRLRHLKNIYNILYYYCPLHNEILFITRFRK